MTCDICDDTLNNSEQVIKNIIKRAQKLREERKEGGAVQNFGRYGIACVPEFYEVLLDTLSEDEEKHCDRCIYIHFK